MIESNQQGTIQRGATVVIAGYVHLEECSSAEGEAVSSNPGRTTNKGLTMI